MIIFATKKDFKYDISVIITVYNRKRLLIRALKSVLSQSYKDYEIIIIDDGSNDYPEKLLFPIIKKHKNITYCRQNHSGPQLALNSGIKLANGKFITFLDSDDEYEKDHLLSRIKYLLKNKKIDLIHSDAKVIGSEKDFWIPDARNTKKMIHINDCIIGGTLFGKKEVFSELNGFRNIYAYDFDFYRRAVRKFKVIKFNSLTYIYYRNNKDSVINEAKKNLNYNFLQNDKRRKINK